MMKELLVLFCVGFVGCVAGSEKAALTYYESYAPCCPENDNYDPNADTEECDKYSACDYSGDFAVLGHKSMDYVKTHNLVSFYDDSDPDGKHFMKNYGGKKIRLVKDDVTFDAIIADTCGNSDCDNCCHKNAKSTGYLVDVEYYTAINNFGSIDKVHGEIKFTIIDDEDDNDDTDCSWKGHCEGDKCGSNNDCDGDLVCKSGKCAPLRSSTKYPSDVINLYNMDLQIPVDNGKGSFQQIRQPELNTYSSEYFHVDEYGWSVEMFAPENGVTSKNGAGPRTELTEPNNYFIFAGTHKMSFQQEVFDTHPAGVISIAQIKGDDFDYKALSGRSPTLGASCLIIVELTYSSDSKKVEAHMRNETCHGVTFSVGKYELGEKIEIDFEVKDTKVYISSNKVTLDPYSYSWWKNANYGMHFKVGPYDQGTGGSSSKGGRLKLSHLEISHKFP
jgi:hypothetical protein